MPKTDEAAASADVGRGVSGKALEKPTISDDVNRSFAPKSSPKRVWLTFGDGPHPTHTDTVLKVLAKHSITATFFVVGKNVKSYPSYVKKAFDAGHRIANHSYNHPHLNTLGKDAVKKEIEDTHALIKNYLADDWMFRPPYGEHNATVDSVVSDLGYRTVLWSVDTKDYAADHRPDGWVDEGLSGIKKLSNSKVLMHDIHQTTAANLDVFITRIKALGNVTFDDSSPILVA